MCFDHRNPFKPFKVAASRFRYYLDDWRLGLHRKVASSALLIFLTSVGPAMSFGEYLSNNLEGSYGVLEVLVTTALCGTIFSLISGSPLVIVGATGPFSIFGFNCYRLARAYGIPFLPWMSWIMLISGLQHIFLGLIRASTWYLPYITSFSGQVFGVLISMIYIVESCQNVAESFYKGSSAGRLDAAFFYAIIAFGQLAACLYLHGARSWFIFNHKIRDIIADYGPSLTIFAFTGFTLIPSFSSVNIVRINIPTTFNTTSGRAWLVDFNDEGLSPTAKGLAFFPALVLTALYFFDHNVSALLTHRTAYSKSSRPMKPVCYDWDFMVLGVMMIICGALGLPPCNGLIPNSPMHSKALEVYKSESRVTSSSRVNAPGRGEPAANGEAIAVASQNRSANTTSTVRRVPDAPPKLERRLSLDGVAAVDHAEVAPPRVEFDYVVDQRLSNLLQSGMVAVMLVILPALALVPTSVVTGLFLFMGVESLLDGDIFSRLMFPFVQREFLSFLHFDDRLKKNNFIQNHQKQINAYTFIQLVAFGIVFYVTQTAASIAFPLFILLLVPLRFRILPKFKNFFDGDFMDVIDLPLIMDALAAAPDSNMQQQQQEQQQQEQQQEPPPVDTSVKAMQHLEPAGVYVDMSPLTPQTPPPPPNLLATYHSPIPGLHHRVAGGSV